MQTRTAVKSAAQHGVAWRASDDEEEREREAKAACVEDGSTAAAVPRLLTALEDTFFA